jgi:PPPDE putative peptidase domain
MYDLSLVMTQRLSAHRLKSQPFPTLELLCMVRRNNDFRPLTRKHEPGRDYVSARGIHNEDPKMFRQSKGLYPFETIELGATTVSKDSFDRWCPYMMQTGRFSHNAYDLLSRNCNNFCHEALSISTGR